VGDRGLVDRAVGVHRRLDHGVEVEVVERVRRALAVELGQEAEAPQLVDPPVHAGDVDREGRGPGLERGLVARLDVGGEVLERALDRLELALPAALARAHPRLGQELLLGHLVLADRALVVGDVEGQVEAGQALGPLALAVALALVEELAATVDAAHRQEPGLLVAALAVFAVLATLADHLARGAIRLAALVARPIERRQVALGGLEGRDHVLGAAQLRARRVIGLDGGGLLAV
jgi:hypothetical protein